MAAPHSLHELIEAKRVLRARARALRDRCDPALGADLARRVLSDCPPPEGAVVSGFWPIGSEIDIRPLLHTLHGRGHPVVLPVTPQRGNPLGFRLWRPGEELFPEPFGTVRPSGEERVPNFLLVPLLAFNRRGDRLGYGGGFYDRTLAGLPCAFALGCAYAAQEMASLPITPYDVRLDAVATERDVIFCQDR